MKLGKWRQSKGLTQREAGAPVGIPQAAWARYEAGEAVPRPEKMRTIFLITEGEVAPNDFYDVDAWRAELAAMTGEDQAQAAA